VLTHILQYLEVHHQYRELVTQEIKFLATMVNTCWSASQQISCSRSGQRQSGCPTWCLSQSVFCLEAQCNNPSHCLSPTVLPLLAESFLFAWPFLHSRWSYFSVGLTDDILHQRISISFNEHFQFSYTNMRSHPLSLCIPSTTINPYHHSFFVNTPFVWNSIPQHILQLSSRPAFHSALRHFLVA